MKISVSEVIELQKLQGDTLSINALVSNDEGTEFEKFIPASEENLDDIIIASSINIQLRTLFEKCNLTQREIEILVLRFGLDGRNPMTLREVGEKINVTRERVRQIESKAIMKIRRSSHVESLAILMQNPDKALKNIENFRQLYRETGNSNKTFLRDDQISKGKEQEKIKKLKTVYQRFKDFTKEQVDAVLLKLTEEEKELITLRYGKDLENPIPGKLSKEQTYRFYSLLIPKMRRLLFNLNGKVIQEKIDTAPPATPAQAQLTVEYKQTQNTSEQEIDFSLENNDATITRETCYEILKLLKTSTFSQMMNVLSIKEIIIISLRLGYVDGKYFSINQISDFLGLEPQEVIDTMKKVLLLYKDNINQFIDQAIELVAEEPKQLII